VKAEFLAMTKSQGTLDSAVVRYWQHGDRRLVRQVVQRTHGGSGRADIELVHLHRFLDVLERLKSPVREGQRASPIDLLEDLGGDGDRAGRGDAFESRRDIHAVAEDVALVVDDVARVHADAKHGAVGGPEALIALGRRLLQHRRAFHRLHDRREFREEAVAHGLHDLSMVQDEMRLKRAEMPLYGLESSDLVALRHSAVTNDVRGKNCGESPFHAPAPRVCVATLACQIRRESGYISHGLNWLGF